MPQAFLLTACQSLLFHPSSLNPFFIFSFQDLFRSMTTSSPSNGADGYPLQSAAAAFSASNTVPGTTSSSSLPPPSDSNSLDFSRPVADVVSANLLVECIRLSGCEDIVKKCEALWHHSSDGNSNSDSNSYSDSNSNSHSNSHLQSAKTTEQGSCSDAGPQGIYPNDYTFELMSKIWLENKCNDIPSRSQNLFDRYSAYSCTVLYSIVRTELYCTVPCCTVSYCTVLYCTVQYCTVLYCTVLYCTILHCTILYCTEPYTCTGTVFQY